MNSEHFIFESNQLLSSVISTFDEFNAFTTENLIENHNSNTKKLATDFNLNTPELNYDSILCGQCNKAILSYEMNIELGEHFYHTECYKCKCCLNSFSLDENETCQNKKLIPFQEPSGLLYCFNDFIR